MLPGMHGMMIAARPFLATDFREYALGEQLRNNGWTQHAQGDAAFVANYTIIADPDSLSGRCVLVDQAGHGIYRAITWNLVTEAAGALVTDCEILARVRLDQLPTSAGGGGVCRVNGTSGYAGCFDADGSPDSANAIKFTNGVVNGIVAGAEHDATLDTTNRFWIRFRIDGSAVSVKAWQDGSAEPAFASGVDTTYTSGRVGFQTMAHRDYRVDWFSVALNGGTAPGPTG